MTRSSYRTILLVFVWWPAPNLSLPLCQQEFPPPAQPFRVVWNHPDNCQGLNFQQYGFIFNTGRKFIGDEVQTLYRTGKWPTFRGSTAVNGGLPQLVNDTTFAETRADLMHNRIVNFTGLGIFDFEVWRANFNTNYGTLSVYTQQSRQLVKQQHPDWDTATVNRVAEQQWEEGARRVMSGKLAVAQELMPNGHWGYYLYPRTWDGNSTPRQNDKMEWLWRQATGLYPSIYLTNPNQQTSSKINRVSKEVAEALRIQNKFSPPNTVIYPFSNIQQGANLFFLEDHLKVTLGVPADMGADGVVLWGSSSYYLQAGQCNRLQNHLEHVLGPFVKSLTQFMSDCSNALCGGHGRCVSNTRDVFLSRQDARILSAQCTHPKSRFHRYHCRCYSSWSGACCETRTPSLCLPDQVTATDVTKTPIVTESITQKNSQLIG